ncbi:DMT family transporter [Alicyclobacillus ferrooxydans]|uniref:Multidrug transporter n=1 Tax=Alicyclobacillus ferrooxydans TaxID=471514 RepID=A0A0P9GUF0_9BACL|nr:EamA family transporter [Alicyclobacillus ferrooxydans]KPV44886.1 multidrug transporter [Alicyclobacillus ferrooxydans]
MTKSADGREATRSLWWIALGAGLWGLDGVFIVSLLHHFTSTQIVFLEHLVLAVFAIPILVIHRHELRLLNKGDWLAVVFVAWGGSALASIFFTLAFVYGNVNVVLILQKMQPLFAVLLAAWILKERLRREYWILFVAAVIGAYFLTFGFHFSISKGGLGSLVGGIFALAAAALWGGSTVMGKRLVGKVSFTTVTALRFAVALPLLFVIVVVEHPHPSRMLGAFHVTSVWFNLLYQTLVPSLVSLLIYYRGLGKVRASQATLAELAFPATGLLVNYLFLHQTFTPGQWVGFIIVWLAIAQLSRMPSSVTEKEEVATSTPPITFATNQVLEKQ